jgi:WD40 repeat protein
MYFSAGFKSGVLRVFDIENTSIVEELKSHDCAIEHLTYNPMGSLLCVCDAKSTYRVYDTTRGYQVVKTLDAFMPSHHNCASFSMDTQVLATVGEYGSHVNLWDCCSW